MLAREQRGLGRAEGTVGQRAAHVGGLLCWSDFLAPQQLSRSVQIFGPEGIVGNVATCILLMVDVLGVPSPAIIMGELLGFNQDLVLSRLCHDRGLQKHLTPRKMRSSVRNKIASRS
jgi:hypothetical protein